MKRQEVERAVEQFVLQGVAFLPENQPGIGDQLRLLQENGLSMILPVQVKRFLNGIAYYYGTDLTAMRQRYGQAIARKQLIPLPFTGDWVLVPFKVRNPIGRQVVHGWFVAHQIHQLEPLAPQRTRLLLAGGHEVSVYHSLNFCQLQLRHVRLVRHFYEEIHFLRYSALARERRKPFLY